MRNRIRLYERKIGDKIFHYARTCETKEEARKEANEFRAKGFKTRIIKVEYYFDTVFQIFTYPEDRTAQKGYIEK